MSPKPETFASLMLSFGYRHDLRTVFDDFLTMTLCAFSQNPRTGKSYDEDLYMQTIGKYVKDEANIFSTLLACLIVEMEDRLSDTQGNDVLGEFYEAKLSRKGASQYFTPWPICVFMSKSICSTNEKVDSDERLRILDPACGSGRMLMAGARDNGQCHEYYGIDIDIVCVKMTAINLFLSGLFHAEVTCADALSPSDFKVSYKTSFLPLGIFKITNKEESRLWHLRQASFQKSKANHPPEEKHFLPSTPQTSNGSQLEMF